MRCCSRYLFILLEHVRSAKWLRPRFWQREDSSSGAAGANVDQIDPMDELFLAFFDSFKEDKDELKFYKAELASMDLPKTPELRVDYLHIKKYSPQPAYALIAEPDRYLTLCP
uniref:MCM N-terminal domain-containing protein n=1 Tax=Setaria viridis TaxID=4556 RepID=A0A4U6USV2_SETVI|nr:hypothetical protein SEVIR_4G024100v2 [Setaria viridis]